jgi:transcriptional regulator of acetoin/glycerol metabolism
MVDLLSVFDHPSLMGPAALLLQLLPLLAGRVSLAQFAKLAAALGLVSPESFSLVQVLREEGGNVSATARRLRLSPKTIYRRVARAGLKLSSFRTSNGPL